nr:hypothetical protein [Tanacetum cinerariifolium]
MFTDEHAPDYSSPLRFDAYDDDFLEVESDADNVYDDPLDSKGEKIKESKLLIDELDLPCDFLPYSEYDSFNSQDFSRVKALPSPNNEDKVFNPGILIHKKPVKIITRVAQDKKLAISYASLVLEDFDPQFCEPLFFKDVPKSKMLLLFSSKNEEKVFKPGTYTSKKVRNDADQFLAPLPDCGVTHEPYQCQPKNHDYYHEHNSCYDSKFFGFDHGQPPRYTVNHPIFNVHNDILTSQTTIVEQMTQLTSMCEMFCQFVQKEREEKRIEEEQAAKAQNWKLPVCYDDDDDEERSNSLQDNIISGLPPCSTITPNEPIDSLSIGDEHLNTISATESDEFIKSYVKNLVPNPSESEGENGCDLPACFKTFLNVLFDANCELDSIDDQSLSDEDFLEKIFLNHLFEEGITHMKIDQHHFNAEYDLIESMLNHDSFIIPSSSKIDSLLDEFASKLTLLKSILPGIDETDCYSEEDIRLIERLLYDNSSPRPPEEFVSDNSDAETESFSPSPIPVKDSDSLIEEMNLSYTPDDPMPPSIEDDDDDSGRDILIRKELLDNYSLSLPEKSPDLLSYRSLEIFQLFAKCPMMIHGKNIPILDVPLSHFYPP